MFKANILSRMKNVQVQSRWRRKRYEREKKLAISSIITHYLEQNPHCEKIILISDATKVKSLV